MLITDIKKEKEGIVKIVGHLLLDETGSMMEGRDITIDVFNEYFQGLVNAQNMMFSISMFSLRSPENIVRRFVQNRPVDNMTKLSHMNYIPGGNTPLYDAIGQIVREVELRLEGTDKALIVIQTDGRENSSKEYTKESIKKVIVDKQEKGWQFVFLGCEIDAMRDATAIGIHAGSTISYTYDTAHRMSSMVAQSSMSYACSPAEGSADFFGTGGEGVDLTGDINKNEDELV